MKLTFRTKLLTSHVGLVAAVVLVTTLALNRSLGTDLTERLDERLERQARGAEEWVRRTRHPETLALRLAGIVGAHVTIMDLDGRVLGDSDYPDVALPPVPNQGAMPEVISAVKERRAGRATRSTPKGTVHFVAVRVGQDEVLRLGVPLAEIATTLKEMRRRLLYAAGLGILAALALGLLAARVAARPLRAMTQSATKLAQGDYDIRLPTATPDEFGVLSRSLESLGQQLKARISDLTAERDLLSAVLGSMVEGVLVIGADARVVQANPSCARILEVEPPLGGKALGELTLHPRLLSILEEALRGKTIETEIEPAEGHQLAVNVRPLQAQTGGVVAVLHDVTRLRRLETTRRDFVANVSHELRTPVTAIQGYSETLLAGKADPATQRQFLDVIHRHARRIGRLVEDLLKLADLEVAAGDKRVREPVKVGAVARHVRDTVRERVSQRDAKVQLEVDDGLVAVGDPDWIEQVLENLVDNAVKYGRTGVQVTVRGRRQADRAVLEVLDDGPGIDEKHLERLFERFYRVDAGRSRDLGGTGLGLAIVKHFVEAMGGHIGVESKVGAGTKFTVTLPGRASPP